jgi:14-3-3 protein epsilon
MVEYAIEFTKKTKGELTLDERNILSVAFKNAVGSRRASWRVLTSVEQKEEKKEKGQVEKVRKYKQTIEKELKLYCDKVLTLLDEALVPNATTDEARVFYYKMKGDYCRYLAEFQKGEAKDASSNRALEAYQAADNAGHDKLASTHPIRLGLALNFSVFYYEILQQPDKAIEMAKKAFDEAIKDLDNVTDESYKDATLIMQLLRDNLTLWNSDMPEEQE